MIGTDTYYFRAEVSNSDLSELQKQLLPIEQLNDLQAAYRFGNLIDAMITEPHRCDHLNLRVDDDQFDRKEWGIAKEMLRSFRENKLCMAMLNQAAGQAVMNKVMKMHYQGVEFELPVRCKWDLWMGRMGYGGDIKSTTATTQRQFEASLEYFDYDRQRAWYMDIAGSDKDMLIGISKVNYKVFMVPILRGSEVFNRGREKYLDLAFRYWYLFEGF